MRMLRFQRPTRHSGSLLRRWMVELLHVLPTDHVLVLGVDAGLALHDAAKQLTSGYVVGIDPANTVANMARSRHTPATSPSRVHLVQGASEALPLAAATFDRVVTFDVIQSLPDPVGLLREAQRVLQPGGQVAVLWLSALTLVRQGQPPAQAHRSYESVEVIELLLAAGFESPWIRTRYFAWSEGLCAQATKPLSRP